MKKILSFIFALSLFIPCVYADTVSNGTMSGGYVSTATSGGGAPVGSLLLMPIGDSITRGTVASGTWGYRQTLQTLLGVGVYDFVGAGCDPTSHPGYDCQHAGVGGDTTAMILARVTPNLTTYWGGTISVGSAILYHGGTNDMSAAIDPNTVVANVQSAIDLITAKSANISVYVALIIPPTDATRETRTVTYNGLLATQLATDRGLNAKIHTVDMHAMALNDTFGLCGGAGNWNANCMADVSHPNVTGFTAMARQWNSCISSSSNTNCDGH